MTHYQNLQLIPQPRAQALLGISAMTLWRWQQQAAFPKAKIIRGRKYFRAAEIQSWIDEQKEDGAHNIPNAHKGRQKGQATNSGEVISQAENLVAAGQ
jgi:predicted DNA-binding transcriptional regulator AlpA